MAISQILALTAHISFLLWELNIWQALAWHIYPSFKWQFHRFLLWLLIFLSYSESSTFGRPNLGRSNTLSNGNFTDSCSDCSYFFPTLRAQHLADLVWADLSPLKWQFHRFLLWMLIFHSYSELNIWQTRSWNIYPSFKWQFHRFLLWLLIFLSYSESSYLADQLLADLSPQ